MERFIIYTHMFLQTSRKSNRMRSLVLFVLALVLSPVLVRQQIIYMYMLNTYVCLLLRVCA